jgi:hypothetical protein
MRNRVQIEMAVVGALRFFEQHATARLPFCDGSRQLADPGVCNGQAVGLFT